MLNNTTIFILNIIILFIIININNKLKILKEKEDFGVIMSDTLGPKIGEVFSKYFKLNLVPLRQLGLSVESLLKGKLNGNLKVNGNIIVNKDNFEINIHNRNVLLYIHNVNYDPEIIKIAIDIIDSFKTKLDEVTLTDDYPISKDTLEEINKEYQLFVEQKLNQLLDDKSNS